MVLVCSLRRARVVAKGAPSSTSNNPPRHTHTHQCQVQDMTTTNQRTMSNDTKIEGFLLIWRILEAWFLAFVSAASRMMSPVSMPSLVFGSCGLWLLVFVFSCFFLRLLGFPWLDLSVTFKPLENSVGSISYCQNCSYLYYLQSTCLPGAYSAFYAP